MFFFFLSYSAIRPRDDQRLRFLVKELQIILNNVAIHDCFGVVLTGIPLLEESPARQSIFSLRGHY